MKKSPLFCAVLFFALLFALKAGAGENDMPAPPDELDETRRVLAVTEEERAAEEREILSAVGRRYALLPKRTLEVEYNFRYTYYTVDVIRMVADDPQAPDIFTRHEKQHTLRNTFTADYALLDNVTLSAAFPFVYRYENVGVPGSRDVADIGDISCGVKWQPLQSGGRWPTVILYGDVTTASGISPYEIDRERELATGSGFMSYAAGATISKPFDPLVGFASANYTHNANVSGLSQKYAEAGELKKVRPGDSVGLGLGLGFAVSYNASLTLQLSQVFSMASTYYFDGGAKRRSAADMSTSLGIGTSLRVNPKMALLVNVSIGLTTSDPDYHVSFRLPVQFSL